MAIYHAPCRKGSFASSDSASLFIHQLVILRGHCFIISRLLFFFSHITNHALILTILTMIPPGLALLLGSCLGEQAELFLRTGASFLTLKSSILPGEIAFTLPSQQIPVTKLISPICSEPGSTSGFSFRSCHSSGELLRLVKSKLPASCSVGFHW